MAGYRTPLHYQLRPDVELQHGEAVWFAPSLGSTVGGASAVGPVVGAQTNGVTVTRSGVAKRHCGTAESKRVLADRLAKLQKLRGETEELFQNVENQLDSDLKTYTRQAQIVDISATMVSILGGLAKLVRKGFESMELSGKALEKANEEAMDEALTQATDPLMDAGIDKSAEKAKEETKHKLLGPKREGSGLAWALGASVLDGLVKMGSLSFWARVDADWVTNGQSWSTAVTNSPEQIADQARIYILGQKARALKGIDERIRQTERLLNSRAGSGCRNGPTVPPHRLL